MEEKILQVDEDNAYSRLDVFLSSKCDKSRSYIIKAIKEGNVKVNGKAKSQKKNNFKTFLHC